MLNWISGTLMYSPYFWLLGNMLALAVLYHFAKRAKKTQTLSASLQKAPLQDKTEFIQTLQQELAIFSERDHVTGLLNRKAFEEKLDHLLEKKCFPENSLALFFIKLDHFRNINDGLGHEQGDCLLQQVGERLRTQLPPTSFIARLGGDTFITLFLDLKNRADVEEMASHVLKTFHEPFMLGHHERQITTSVGIAIYPQDGQKSMELLKNADMAATDAKLRGGDIHRYVDITIKEQNEARLAIEARLAHAINSSEMFLYYQPVVDMRTGQVVSMEALCRWKNPELGLVAPGTFIPLVERMGLIRAIGEWAIKTACGQYKKWLDAGLLTPDVRIAVNLSSLQLKQENLSEIVQNIVETCQIPISSLELELTESVMLAEQSSYIQVLEKLHRLGICIAIDDFGTGYSSLSYLKTLPVHILKIDRSFVRDINSDPTANTIVKAIIELANALNLSLIAEGIESAEEQAFLCENGCYYGQGYLYSKPLSTSKMTAYLKEKGTSTLPLKR